MGFFLDIDQYWISRKMFNGMFREYAIGRISIQKISSDVVLSIVV